MVQLSRRMICGGLSKTLPQDVGGCGATLTAETRREMTRASDEISLPDGTKVQVKEVCVFCPECAAKHEKTSWVPRQRSVRFSLHELEEIQAALGGPYKPSEFSFYSAGLSSHEALQIKIDEELVRRREEKT